MEGSVDNNQEMLIRIDEKLSSLTLLVASNNERHIKEINELWAETNALSIKIDALAALNLENTFSARVGRAILFLVSSVGLGVAINKLFSG